MNENEITRSIFQLTSRLDALESITPVVVKDPHPSSDADYHIHELDKARIKMEAALADLAKRVPNLDDLAHLQQEIGAIRKELADCIHLNGKDPNKQFVDNLQPVLTMLSNLNKKVDVALKQASRAADQASSAVKVHCRIAAETLEAAATAYAQE